VNNMVFMDERTKESLDFQYVLDNLDTITPYGAIYKKRLRAYELGEENKLKEELEKIESFIPIVKDKGIIRELDNIFSQIKDLRSSVKRGMEGFILTEVELFEVKNFLYLIRRLYSLIKENNMPVFEDTLIKPIESLEKILDPENTGLPTFYIYDSYSEELKKIRDRKREIEKEIKLERDFIKKKVKEELSLDLKPDATVVLSKDEKELIEKVQNSPYLTYNSETYMTIKFSIKPTERLSKLEAEKSILKDKEEKEELRIREELSKEIGKRNKELFTNMSNIGRLDLLIGKAKLAVKVNGIKPEILNNHVIDIEEGIHPKVAEVLESKGLKFTPISISLNQGVTCITGANMGGKTVTLKLIGLLSAMAQHGLFVPAKSMKYGLNRFIKASIGDMQSTSSGLSTFGGEIKIVQEAISQADSQGLILIDELARGTNPEEGYAISKAIVSYLRDKNSITVLTTHYDNVANLDRVVHLQVIGLSNVDMDKLAEELDLDQKMDIINKYMDYRLRVVEKDTPVPKDAINIAMIMGLDKEIIKLAEKYLTD